MSYRCSLQWILQNLRDKTSLKGAAEVKPAVLHVFMLCTLGSVEALIHPTALQQNKHLHQYHCMYCSWEWCLCEASSVNSVANGNSNTAGKSWTVNPDFVWYQHYCAFLMFWLGTLLWGELRLMATMQRREISSSSQMTELFLKEILSCTN